MIHVRYIQLLYIFVITIVTYVIYQMTIYKKPTDDGITENKPGNKVRAFLFILIITVCLVIYFNIGLDEIQIDGESKLRNLLDFEKSMIQKINDEVDVGVAPF